MAFCSWTLSRYAVYVAIDYTAKVYIIYDIDIGKRTNSVAVIAGFPSNPCFVLHNTKQNKIHIHSICRMQVSLQVKPKKIYSSMYVIIFS